MAAILVVDDESPVREMIRAMIESDGHEIHEACNGVEARRICEENAIDLIITDLVMPEKNGIDFIMEVKKSHPNVPVIAISGGGGITGRFDYLQIAKLVGASNILRKPFAMEKLRSTIRNVLKEKIERDK